MLRKEEKGDKAVAAMMDDFGVTTVRQLSSALMVCSNNQLNMFMKET